MRARDELLAFTEDLLAEGTRVIATKYTIPISSFDVAEYVDLQQFRKWSTSTMHLLQMLGSLGEPWKGVITVDSNSPNFLVTAVGIQGALESIRENLKAGRLARVEELLAAETFANLLEQAAYLLEGNYFLASGVLCRAVLEERLRVLCSREQIAPAKNRPTINDYAQSLYAANAINKITLKGIEALAATGNDAAHNVDTLTAADVRQLHASLVDFLQRFEP